MDPVKKTAINVSVVTFALTFAVMVYYKQYQYSAGLIVVFGVCLALILLKGNKETFVESTIDTAKVRFLQSLLTDQAPLPTTTTISTTTHKEDMTSITPNLEVYISSYSGSSYSGSGDKWFNIAPSSKDKTYVNYSAEGQVDTRDFLFDEPPSFLKEKGVFLGRNKLKGPMSWTLGINGNGEFTVFLVCKHDDLSTIKKTNIMKLFGNSNNNNGLAIDVIDIISNPVQNGRLAVEFAGDRYESGIRVPLDPNVVYLYVLRKTSTSMSIHMMSSINASSTEVFRTVLKTPDVLFSNKPMMFNMQGNWNAYMKAFGTYNKSLKSEEIRVIYDHIMKQEKQLDTFFIQQEDKYNKLLTQVNASKTCQFDPITCKACTGIKDWSVQSNILTSDLACRKAIDMYCQKNQNVEYCTCWNTKATSYNTPQCKTVRSLHQSDQKGLEIDKLDTSALDLIKKKYGLSDSKTCQSTQVPKVPKAPIIDPMLLADLEQTPAKENTSPKRSKLTFFEWLTSGF